MNDPRTTELGYVWNYVDLIDCTKAVWGGISWPTDEQEGFVTVVAAGRKPYKDGYELFVLDEFHSFNVLDMVRQCIVFDSKYWISWPRMDQSGDPKGRWIADETHEAAQIFIKQLATEKRIYSNIKGRPNYHPYYIARSRRDLKLRLQRTHLLDIEHLYDYLIPQFIQWLQPERKLLYLKNR